MQTYTVNQQKSARGTSNTDLTVAIGKRALKFVRKAEQDQPLRKSSGEILKMFLGFYENKFSNLEKFSSKAQYWGLRQ